MEGERSKEGAISWEKVRTPLLLLFCRASYSSYTPQDPKAGIIPRSLHHLFEELEKQKVQEFSVRVSFLELYNEELFDLLASVDDNSKLRIFEDASRKVSHSSNVECEMSRASQLYFCFPALMIFVFHVPM